MILVDFLDDLRVVLNPGFVVHVGQNRRLDDFLEPERPVGWLRFLLKPFLAPTALLRRLIYIFLPLLLSERSIGGLIRFLGD